MISNISYNSIDYLRNKCDELVKCGDIDFYMFIFHHKEECELDDHIHIILYPSHQIDTKKFDKHFIEFRLDDSELPFGFSKVWKPVSKDCDLEWILYVLHDEVYCKAKCKGDKKFRYLPKEIISNDERTKQELVFSAYHETSFYHDLEIQKLIIDNNMNGADLIKNGYVPIKQACSYHHFTQMLNGG